ncbi:hypothetical protein JZ751_029781 [Albula glossodonta]|uniref:Uncharacterized protein n=1 Tax=Albula glossodonta TaxID=121402 RepID=A0A8T2N9N9_9TELE|nr:hypothetical protein JZ751_029781 [Albula glossodonta]
MGTQALAGESATFLSMRFTEMRLLLDEEEHAAKALVEEETRAALEVYDEQVRACQERAEATDGFANEVQRMYKQDSNVQLLKDFTAAEQDIRLHQQPADQIHPIPLSFEHTHGYIASFHKALRTIVRMPIEQRIKKGTSVFTFQSTRAEVRARCQAGADPDA